MKTVFLPVIGLHDVMYHMAMSSRKGAAGEVKHKLRNHYIQGVREVTRRV